MKFVIFLTLATMVAVGILACTLPEPSNAQPEPVAPQPAPPPDEAAPASAAAPAPHPEIPEEAIYRGCVTCHKVATPEIYKDWFASTHGIGNVRCFQCHGTYENFRKVPEMTTCAVCHQGQMASRTDQEKACWECHAPHLFRGHSKEAK